MDSDGRIKLIGRLKELIIKGGENVYPKEIEEVLFTHPLIESAAVNFELLKWHFLKFNFNFIFFAQVFGVPHERYGETIGCWIKLGGKEILTKEELQDFCRQRV